MTNGHGSRFDISLAAGEAREDAFIHVLRARRVEHIEHKRDHKNFETGNIAVEFAQGSRNAQWRKPSGIAVSEADVYAIEFRPNRWLLIETPVLADIARFIYKSEPLGPDGQSRRVKCIGDNNNWNVLVPLEALFTNKLDGPLSLYKPDEGWPPPAAVDDRKAA